MAHANDPNRCDYCGVFNQINSVLRENYRVCTECGTVQKQDCSRELQAQTFAQSRAQSIVEEYQQPGTKLSKRYLHTMSRANRATLSKAQSRMKNLVHKLEDIVHSLQCCKMLSDRATSIMYRVLRDEKVKRIKKDELLCSVSLMFAAREAHIQYTFREVAESCVNVTKKEICRVYKRYERILSKVAQRRTIEVDVVRFTPMIPRFATSLGLGFLEQKKIRSLFAQINRCADLCTLNPMTRLSVAIYRTMGKHKPNCELVSRACNVSAHTIQKSSELVDEYLNDPDGPTDGLQLPRRSPQKTDVRGARDGEQGARDGEQRSTKKISAIAARYTRRN